VAEQKEKAVEQAQETVKPSEGHKGEVSQSELDEVSAGGHATYNIAQVTCS